MNPEGRDVILTLSPKRADFYPFTYRKLLCMRKKISLLVMCLTWHVRLGAGVYSGVFLLVLGATIITWPGM